MSTNNDFDVDPTECEELLRTKRLVCVSDKHNKDYQGVFAIHPKTKEIVSWVEWGPICDLGDKKYKKQFKVHYAGANIDNAINPIEKMLSKKASGRSSSKYTLENGQRATWSDLSISEAKLRAAISNWHKDHQENGGLSRPRKRMRAGNVLIPFAKRTALKVK